MNSLCAWVQNFTFSLLFGRGTFGAFGGLGALSSFSSASASGSASADVSSTVEGAAIARAALALDSPAA